MYNLATGLITQLEANPYRHIYLREKQKFLDRGISKGHADNHGKRVMFKRFLADLWEEVNAIETTSRVVPTVRDDLKEAAD